MRWLPFSFAMYAAFALTIQAFGQDDLDILFGRSPWLQHSDARNALYHHLSSEALDLLRRRSESVAVITSPDAWKERQQWVRNKLHEITGPFPKRTPLNARVTKVIEKDFYRIEHIVYESQPKFYVTSSLFVPKSLQRRRKAPAVVYCSGHGQQGYRSQVYQHIILNLVRKGFIVFAFDPVGQGERLEYLDEEKGTSRIGGPTREHSYPGSQVFISGSSQARYMIWDGIRAVDYLLTRPEVDATRIGITGRSGGGTQSSYIAAFDERIAAAAPECYITSFARLFQSIGPQDAEQNFFNGIASGIDHADLLIVRAPKPTLLITTTGDFFSIQGARETATEVSRTFQTLGAANNFRMVEDDAGHASTKKNREAMYAFFQEHLKNPGNPDDEEVKQLTAEELKVTPTGQVSTSFRGETVFSLNVKEMQGSQPQHAMPGTQDWKAKIIAEAKARSGYRPPGQFTDAVFTGRIPRDGYAIEKYFVPGEGDYVIPFLLAVPSRSNGKTILYLDPSGKAKEASKGGAMERLVGQGFTVLSPDLPGIGELGTGSFKGDAFIGGVSHNLWYSAMLIGRSIVGVQAGDISRVLSGVASIAATTEVHAIAKKELVPALLHAAAFDDRISKIAFIEPLTSFRSLVETRYYHSPFIVGAVPGMLKAYDLPDLAATLAPRELVVINPLDGAGNQVDEENATLPVALKATYSPARLHILTSHPPDQTIDKLIALWQQ